MAAARQNLTDRAFRYRAQAAIPAHEVRCAFCGRPAAHSEGKRPVIMVGHVDGREDNDAPDNLTYTCRPCNSIAATALRNAGIGRLTRQYNPTKAGGAANLGEWMQAVGAITPHTDRGDRGLSSSMSVSDAVAMIRATPHAKRSQYAAKLRHNPGKKQNLFGFGPKPVVEKPKRRRSAMTFPQAVRAARAAGAKGELDFRDFLEAKHLEDRGDPVIRRLGEAYRQGIDDREESEREQEEKRTAPKEKGTYRGYKVFRTPDGEYYSSLDKGSLFDTFTAVRKHIDWYVNGRGNPANRKRSGAGTGQERGKRGNPADAAVKAFEEFHGHKPKELITVAAQRHHHKHLAGAGELRRLVVKGVDHQTHTITGFRGALLAFNEEKNQLFVVGGDQAINLEDFGITKPHELETLGTVVVIDYHTRKDHLGDEGGEAVYTHQFRTTNEAGQHVTVTIARYPTLIYRVRDEQLEFAGGSYTIRAEGIDK